VDWDTRLRELETRLLRAQKRIGAASEQFTEATRNIPSGIPHPDGVLRIQLASKEYLSAIQEFENASRDLTTFLVVGDAGSDSTLN
jgi:hypothetical protein